MDVVLPLFSSVTTIFMFMFSSAFVCNAYSVFVEIHQGRGQVAIKL